MSDTFDPGPGWREVQYGHELEGHEHISWDSTGLAGGTGRMWVRESPAPPLPTAPYTVIRAMWKPGGDGAVQETYVRADALGDWCNVNTGVRHQPSELRAGITGFEILAEPRTVTAKAVLDRARAEAGPGGLVSVKGLAREFGLSDE